MSKIEAEKAEAEKQASLAPDVEKLQAYIHLLNELESPVMATESGSRALSKIQNLQDGAVFEMVAVIDSMKQKEAA